MIISRTPFRVSLFGGGSDYPAWYKKHGGNVISTTINKYAYITCRYLPPFFDYRYLIRYYKREEVQCLDDIQHPSVRECLRMMNIKKGVEMVHNADLPAQSGMGSSSTFTVGLINALYALEQKMPTKRELALKAIDVEQNLINENVGSQDQTAAAFGGFNKINFNATDEIGVNPLILPKERLRNLEDHLILFFTGLHRTASDIVGEQVKRLNKKEALMHEMQEILQQALNVLISENNDLNDIGRLLHEQWFLKKMLSPLISNPYIDEIYSAGMDAGAIGGKLLGAGAGGCILFYVKPEFKEKIKSKLKNILFIPFRFETLGSQIIYFSH